jgi:peroxiredoxin
MKRNPVDTAIKAAIGVLLVALACVIVSTMNEHITDVGDMAPKFSLTTDQGIRMTPKNFGGKVLVLNFWGTWCAPCVEEVPSLNQFARTLAPSGVVVLGVSIDRNPKLYEQFLKRFQVSYQTFRDPDALISADYGTYKYPETYIIDKTGRVVQKVISAPPKGWMDPELVNYVKSLL